MDKSTIPTHSALSTMKRDYADEVYIAANLAGMGCDSQTVIDRAFVTIGDFTYITDERDTLYMFPYGRTYGHTSSGPVYNRTFWDYGVMLDEWFISDNRKLMDSPFNEGFPVATVKQLLSDLARSVRVMGNKDINTITG